MVCKNDRENKFVGLLVQGIVKVKRIEVVVYESVLKEDKFLNSKIIDDLDEFKSIKYVIVSIRLGDNLLNVVDKVYNRD